MNEKITYPIYRKYKNDKSYFKVISIDEFEEIQVNGIKKTFNHFTAKILPDRNFIYDMIHDFETNWYVCTHEEYEELKKSIQ